MPTDTTKKIVYKDDDGTVCVITPSGELPFEDVCKKDVPAGKEYFICDASELPPDRNFRNAWTVEIESPDGTGIGSEAYWAGL